MWVRQWRRLSQIAPWPKDGLRTDRHVAHAEIRVSVVQATGPNAHVSVIDPDATTHRRRGGYGANRSWTGAAGDGKSRPIIMVSTRCCARTIVSISGCFSSDMRGLL